MTTRNRSKRLLRTTDLTLSTYLLTRGHTATLVQEGIVKGTHPQGAWEFIETPKLTADVETFLKKEALVEPDMFHNKLNTTRRAMFEFLGIDR